MPQGNRPRNCLMSVRRAIVAVRNNRIDGDRELRSVDGLAAEGAHGTNPARVRRPHLSSSTHIRYFSALS